MNKRLSVRFGFYFVAIAVLSIALVALVSNYFVNQVFDRYVESSEDARNQQIAESLGKSYSSAGAWTPELLARIPQWATMMGVRIRLVARDGRLILDTVSGPDGGSTTATGSARGSGVATGAAGDSATSTRSAGGSAGGRVTETQPGDAQRGTPIAIVATNQKYVANAYISRLPGPTGLLRQARLFRRSINNALLVSGLIAAAIALLISSVVSQRLVRPLQAVTAAAQAMEAGDLSHRVPTTSGDEVGELGAAFNRMADALQHQERLRKNLTADVAHELRTPLATIQSQVEALQDSVIQPDAKNLESIHEEVVRLARLVGDLRQLSEAEGGTLTLATQPVDLNEFVAETVAGLEPRFTEEDVTLDTEFAETPQTALVDRDKARQVIINLVSNALKFAPSGGWVRVSVATEKGFRTITVADNGPGIEEKDLPYIFERFFRTDKSRSRATGGAGIGLAITKELVEAHGGHITVSSVMGQGTTFTVSLPATKPEE